MRDLPLASLRAFAVAYQYRGVRAAARELGIAHSSVSRHLNELARWVGVALVRGGGGRAGLLFTRSGEALGQAVLRGLRDIERVAYSLREAKSPRSVTIAAAPSLAARWLLPRLPRFKAAHPRIEISIIGEQKRADPDGTDIDLAIRMGRGPWDGVTCEPLMDDALYPVMSPAFWRQSGRPSRTASLARLPLIHDRDPQACWEAWRRAKGPPSLDVSKGSRFTSTDLVLRAAAQGHGVALARHQLVQEELKTGSLLRPLGDEQIDLGVSYWIILPKDRRPNSASTAIVSWLKRQV